MSWSLTKKIKSLSLSLSLSFGVCGGHDGKNCLSSSEAYDAELNMWNPISSLKQSRNGYQSITSSGCLHTVEGFNRKNYSSSVEQLDGLDLS